MDSHKRHKLDHRSKNEMIKHIDGTILIFRSLLITFTSTNQNPSTGSMLEGGGQILRNAASISAILEIPVHIDNIRAKRSKPGLRPQHLTGLRLVSDTLSHNARLQGGSIGSEDITLYPGKLIHTTHDRTFVADTGTAGSCMLLGQIALPCVLFSRPQDSSTPSLVDIELRGGTDAPMAPPADYFKFVLLPTLCKHLHIQASLDIHRRGFYPKGNGLVRLHAMPLASNNRLPPLKIVERGAIMKCTLRAFTAGNVKESVAHRMIDSAMHVLKQRMKLLTSNNTSNPTTVQSANTTYTSKTVEYITHILHYTSPDQAFGDGCGLLIVAESQHGYLFGSTGLGERGVPAEAIGQKAADELMDVLQVREACVDDYLLDQLVIFMALAEGTSTVMAREPSLHARTAMALAECMTGARFVCTPCGDVDDDLVDGAAWKIVCHGVGVQPTL